jgi:hypothetical protein
MNSLTHRLTSGFAAVVASTITLGAVLSLFAHAGDFHQARQHLPGGAGVAERYRAMQPTANDNLLAPRAGVTAFRAMPDAVATL